MLNDKYHLKSSINKSRKGRNQNIHVFLDYFNNFYNNLRIHNKPNFMHDMCDPYGFSLLCKDYSDRDVLYDKNLTCKEIFEGKATEEDINIPTYQAQFSFVELLDMLYLGFLFDYQVALDVYNNQHNAFDVFNQILNGDGYIYNRARPNLAKAREARNVAFESIINLNENRPINLPHVWRLCDGMIGPFVVSKFHAGMHIEEAECHGFGKGLFIISNNEIIDCLKINDTWFTSLPLEHRLFFAHKCTEYEVQTYGKAWSWRSVLDVGKMLEANSTEGLLVRGCRETFFNNRWFNWSKTSLVYCKKKNGELVSRVAGRYSPEFYTLEGDEGLIDPIEEKKNERIYLDDWDIKEFQKILTLDSKI